MHFIRSCFNNNSPDTKLLARYVSVILWAIGSLYMINIELAKPTRDWLVILSMPLIWAVVIILPILCWQSLKEKRYGSFIALLTASLIGSTFTLESTISRQASKRDNNVEQSFDNDVSRTRLKSLIKKDEDMLAEEMKAKSKKCANAKFDCNGIDESITVYQSSLANHRLELSKLGNRQSPRAGEKRIAQFISDLLGYEIHIANKFVSDIIPLIFGLFLELAAFATAVYGWHGLMHQEQLTVTKSNSISQQTEKIVFLEHQLQISNDQLDRRVITKQLAVAKDNLINALNKRG
jgi:hypothetical protein